MIFFLNVRKINRFFSFSAARESQELLELLGLPDIKDLLASPVSVV